MKVEKCEKNFRTERKKLNFIKFSEKALFLL